MVGMCMPHWEKMREAVDARGMDGLVHKTGEAAMSAVVRELEGEKESEDWDPLLAANFAIISRLMENIGHAAGPEQALAFMASEHCPLCLVQDDFDNARNNRLADFNPEFHKDSQWWIDSCMDAMLAHARSKGLVPLTQ